MVTDSDAHIKWLQIQSLTSILFRRYITDGEEEEPSLLFWSTGELLYRAYGVKESMRVIDWLRAITPRQLVPNFWHKNLLWIENWHLFTCVDLALFPSKSAVFGTRR